MEEQESAGSKIGRYELHALLGRGGFGTVYRAYDTRLDVERAVKILHPILNSSPEYISRFAREARVVARMDHPNIVPVYDFDHDNARHFLVMRYMAGGSLSTRIQERGALPFQQALTILRDATAALDYAHELGLIHRDVKPANVLFEADGAARLGDFGFARALTGEEISSLSLSGGLLGTPAYMAPELWRNRPATPASDVYSLGCLATEMLTGKVLFAGDSPAEIMTLHVLDGPQLPARWPAAVPGGLEAVLRRALARKPEDRFATAADFYRALSALGAAKVSPPQVGPPQVGPPRAEPPPPGPQAYRAEVEAAVRRGEWTRAETALAQWLELAPHDPDAIAIRVELARRRVEKTDDARVRRAVADIRERAEDAARLQPASPAAAQTVASTQAQQSERESAVPRDTYQTAAARIGTEGSASPEREEKKRKKPIWIPVTAFAGLALMMLCVAATIFYGNLGAAAPGVKPTSLVVGEAPTEVAAAPLATRTLAPSTAQTPDPSRAEAEAAIATLSVLQDMARTALAEQIRTRQANPDAQSPLSGGETEEQMLASARESWPWVALDNFDANNNGWTETTVDDVWGHREFTIEDGVYSIDLDGLSPSSIWAYGDIQPLQDFYVALDVEVLAYSDANIPAYAGLLLRENQSGYYKFEVSPLGYFLMGYQDLASGVWTDIYPLQSSPAIRINAPNRLEVIAQGTEMWLYINEQFVGAIAGAYTTAGNLGPLVSLYAYNESASVEFDNFELRAP